MHALVASNLIDVPMVTGEVHNVFDNHGDCSMLMFAFAKKPPTHLGPNTPATTHMISPPPPKHRYHPSSPPPPSNLRLPYLPPPHLVQLGDGVASPLQGRGVQFGLVGRQTLPVARPPHLLVDVVKDALWKGGII